MLGKTNPETAEQLMRSRYTAYVQRNIPYLKSTLTKRSQRDFDAKASKEWAEGVEWLGLTIVSTEKGGLGDNRGIVEFAVKYKKDDEVMDHHEVSRFERNDEGDWKFHDGDVHTHKDGESCDHHPKIETYVRDTPKIGRNDPCSCGSGKKFKKCCA